MRKILPILFILAGMSLYGETHEITVGLTTRFHTDFQSHTDLTLGLKVGYLYSLGEKPIGEKGNSELKVGFSSGILLQGGNVFPRALSISKPVMIPLNGQVEYYISPWKNGGFLINYTGGMNFSIHSGGVISPLWVSSIGTGGKVYLGSRYNLRLLAQYGLQGYARDYWYGPGVSLLLGYEP